MDDSGLPKYIVDACCILNFYASGRLFEILETLEGEIYTTNYVIREECKYIREGEEKISVDLGEIIANELLLATELKGEEYTTFVNMIELLDDGEAECAAIAHHRNYILVTDDKNAIKKLENNLSELSISVVSGVQWVRQYAEGYNLSDDEIQAMLQRFRDRASFIPWKDHELKGWWDRFF